MTQQETEQISSGAGFATFTLAELTLIQEGLWRLGRQDETFNGRGDGSDIRDVSCPECGHEFGVQV